MASLVHFNTTHVVPNGYNNTLRYEIGNTSANMSGLEVAVDRISVFNSQANISPDYNNNTFQILVPTLATYQTLDIVLPEGIYELSQINEFVQLKLYQLGAYYTDPNGDYVYNIQISGNTVNYTAQIDLSPTLTSFPVDWDTPSGLYFTSAPTTGFTPKIVIPNTDIAKVFGLAPGTYPSTNQTTVQTFESTICPQLNPVSSYIIRCNLVSNAFSVPSDVLTSFYTQGTLSGQTIDVRPSDKTWIPITNGSRSYIELQIVDEYMRFVKFKDPKINIDLIIRPIKD